VTEVSKGDVPQPRSLTLLQRIAAYVTAMSVIVGAAFGVWHFFFDNGGGGSTVAESGTVDSVAFTPHGDSATVDTQVHVFGQKGRHVRVLWTLYDAEQTQPVQDPEFQDQLVADVVPTSDDFTRGYSANVPPPTTTDMVYLRVSIYDDSHQRLDFKNSARFRVGGVPSG
jgi:hypothetical protein